MKVSFVIDKSYLKNEIFNNNSCLNRDNCFYPYILLKECFNNYNYKLSTYDINPIDESKYVIYNDMPRTLPKKEDISKSFLLLFESSLIRPDNWDIEKHQYFNKIFTWDDRVIDNKKYFKINFSHLFPESINKDLSKKKKLCTLIAGNKLLSHSLELYSKRIEAIRWFEKYHIDEFDLYGVGWDKYTFKNKYINFIFRKTRLSNILKPKYTSYKGSVNSKKEVMKDYKFSICYENARDIDGYITEKIFDCFFAGCVPIYWGANNIMHHIPKECFIDKREFDSYEKLYDFINEISDKKYLEYISNIELYLSSEDSKYFKAEYFADTIVENIINDKINK